MISGMGREVSPRFIQFLSPLPSSIDDVQQHYRVSYYKLPEQLLNLSVLKLDGSSFEIQISRAANIADLKLAVEDLFERSCKVEGDGNISWTHVWGHFCLSYDGQKLLNDNEYLQKFGIKDGDQLLFERHLSTNYIVPGRRSRNRRKCQHMKKMSPSGVHVHEDGVESNDCNADIEMDLKYDYIRHATSESMIIRSAEFNIALFVRRCMTFLRLWSRRKTRSEGKAPLMELSRS